MKSVKLHLPDEIVFDDGIKVRYFPPKFSFWKNHIQNLGINPVNKFAWFDNLGPIS